jgi:hypothetical protein
MDPNESGNLIKNFVVQIASGANETATAAQAALKLAGSAAEESSVAAAFVTGLSQITELTGSGTTLTKAHSGNIYMVQTDVDHVIDLPEDDPGGPFSVAFIQAGNGGQIVFSATNGTINSYNGLLTTAGQHAWASLIRTGVNTYNLSGTLA